ncbi:MAG: tyrosine-type recombinase/integrase [bacterium]|nr:tyrosine-type recombinase/integrase [bacterium]
MLHELAIQFLEHIEIEKNRSPRTVQNYGFYLNRFLDWAKKQGITRPDAVSLDVVRNYRLWLNRQPGKTPLKKNTQNYHLIALRSFLKYLAKRDVKTLAPEKIELAKTSQRTVGFLDGDDLERLLTSPLKTHDTEIIKKRDRAILEVLFSTGLRVSELSSLKRDTINLGKDEFTVKGKGDKYRIVFLSSRAREHIKIYLDLRKDILPPLFLRHDRAFNPKRSDEDADFFLTPRSIQRLVQKYAKIAGVTKKITPHVMRHSFATDLLMNGADIRSVQSLLGHASITTTQIYTHITNQHLQEVHKAFHGKRRKR